MGCWGGESVGAPGLGDTLETWILWEVGKGRKMDILLSLSLCPPEELAGSLPRHTHLRLSGSYVCFW